MRAKASFTSIIGCFVSAGALIVLEADPNDSLMFFLADAFKDSVKVSNTNLTSFTVSALSNVFKTFTF